MWPGAVTPKPGSQTEPMSTQHAAAENASETSFQAIESSRPLTRAQIDACAPHPDGDAATRRLYAVARQNGVAHYGPGELQQRDAARVLYLAPDGTLAAELQVPTVADDYSEIPRSITVRPESDRVREPSEAVVERFGAVLDRHYETDA